jgi:type I restriction-modification enzyme, S subunit, ecoA family (fragment)
MRCKLADICSKIGSGATPRGGKEAYCEKGISLVRSQNVLDFSFSHDGLAFINNEQAAKLSNVEVFDGDVLLNITGDSVARACIMDSAFLPARVNQHVAIVRGKKSHVLNRYLLYFLQWQKGYLLQLASAGATRNALTKGMLEQLEIDLPSLDEQKRIVAILGALDDKIELNNKINENLEQQATALFNNFYDQAETEISFTDVIQILGGGTPKTGESGYWGGKIPFFTPKDIGSPYTLNTEKTITEAGLARCNSRLYPINTVFVTARGTVGKVGMAGVPMAMNQSCYALVGKGIHQLLVYFYTLKVIDRLRHKASGAVFDAVTTKDFESEHIMRLPESIEKVFLCAAEPMYQAILSNSIENQKLAGLRDALLPKLISGEIDVSGI